MSDLVKIAGLLGLALAVTLSALQCTAPARHACEDRGGVYLYREGACVAAPPAR